MLRLTWSMSQTSSQRPSQVSLHCWRSPLQSLTNRVPTVLFRKKSRPGLAECGSKTKQEEEGQACMHVGVTLCIKIENQK